MDDFVLSIFKYFLFLFGGFLLILLLFLICVLLFPLSFLYPYALCYHFKFY